ncbi:MAG: extracellular solute-binding protein [Clostridia bacterium]|nr:extracellular solute-binding protein [Clostridia bacterium]MBO7658153.1 extracellular solute-binding protein [Clostridia bacterium]MBP5766242.1 extracellular solute-binding protein [Clostridia bacterium]
MKSIFSHLKKIAFLCLAVCLLFAATACKPKEYNSGELPQGYIPEVGGKLKVSCRADVYPSESSRKSVRNWINAFRSKYPNVTIETDFSIPDYAPLISSKTIGDVFWLSDADVYNYAVTMQALMALDSYVEAMNVDLADIYSGILNLCEARGKLYFAGMSCGNVVFTYNVDALVEAGILQPGERVANDWTWEDFKSYAQQLKKYDEDGITLTQVGAGFPLYWPNTFTPFLYAYGGEWVDKTENKVMLSNEKVRQGIQEVIDAIDNRWIYPEGSAMSAQMATEYGKVSTRNGCVFAYNQAYTVLTTNADIYNTRGINWDVAPWPLFPEKASPCGTLGFGVFSYTRNSDTAAALVLSLFSEEGQLAFHGQEGGDVPVLKKLGDQDFWHLTKEGYEGKNYAAFTANYDRYVPGQVNACVPPEVSTIIENGIKNLFDNYCRNAADWVDSLAKIEEQCNQLWAQLE